MPDPRTITIQGGEFQVAQPYVEGHQCTEHEARTLNQTRSENIRNNLAARIKAHKEGKNGAMTMDEIVVYAKTYDEEYTFAKAPVGSGRRTLDPVEREARKLSREAIKLQLSRTGDDIKNKSKEWIADHVDKLSQQSKVIKLAQKRIKDQEALKETIIEEMDAQA